METLVEKVIQFGEGGFLRSFVDYFIEKMNNQGLFNGNVVIVQPIENGLCDLLSQQDCKYNLFLRGMQSGEVVHERTKINSISRCVNPYTEYSQFLMLAHNPDMRFIISNTTEAGIEFIDTDKFDDAPPKSFPAKLTRLMYERFSLGLNGFVLFPCELIDNNADLLKKYVLQYAELWQLGDEFISWINDKNTFCNTLVDRIATGYPRDEIVELEKIIGYSDKMIDTAEIFHLWVIEGDFETEFPLKQAGINVVWTTEVTPYKKRKVRILNGAHTSMVLAGHLYGLTTVGECMKDSVMSSYLEKCLFEEIIPTLGNSDVDVQFGKDVIERFENPYIKHLLLSIALNSVSKFKVRVLPSIIAYRNLYGKNPKYLSFSFAALIAFYKTSSANDGAYEMEFLKNNSVADILTNTKLWGDDIDLSFLVQDVQKYYDVITTKSVSEGINSIN